MKLFIVVLALFITNEAIGTPQKLSGSAGGNVNGGASADGASSMIPPSGQAGGSASGNVDVGGCSISANGDANGANGGANVAGSASLSLDGCSSNSGKGPYTYEIKAKRTEVTIPPTMIIYLYYQQTPSQNMTYFVTVDEDHPFVINGVVLFDNDVLFEEPENSPDPIKSCDQLDNNSWRYVLLELIVKNLMPEGKCPVDEGNYMIDQEVDPISVTFDEMISCGDYQIIDSLTWNDKWAGHIYYDFTIPDDGNCTPK